MCIRDSLVIWLDIWLQMERRTNNRISKFTKAAIGIYIVNILLWIDFNISMVRRKNRNETQPSRLRCLTKGSYWSFHSYELLAVL